MRKTKITVPLSVEGMNTLIEKLLEWEKWVEKCVSEFTKKLADIGLQEASIIINMSRYNHEIVSGITTQVIPIENGYKIVASGEAICFIEFGAGVYYNKNNYLGERPAEISNIGEYGKGKGKNDYWWYTKDGEGEYTHGTMASMPMYYASKEMQEKIQKIADEVFK